MALAPGVSLGKGDAKRRGTMDLFRASLTAAALLALWPPCHADPAPIIHYAPTENLEHVDVALIDTARQEIDLAAYVLTDWPVMRSLTRAAERGVKVRVYLDGVQLAAREPAKVFNELAQTPGVPAIRATATGPLQPSQRNQAEQPEFRAVGAKSKAANFRAVETQHEAWTTPFFKMGGRRRPVSTTRDGHAWITLPFPRDEILVSCLSEERLG
jgi:hypothetical protein